MSPDFSIGLLVTDDDIDAVILEGWPADVRKPCIVVFDYAGHDVPDEYVLPPSRRSPRSPTPWPTSSLPPTAPP